MLTVEHAGWRLDLYLMARNFQSGVVIFSTCFRHIDHESEELLATGG